MKGLKFYDTGHIYEYDGQIIPSVSELCRFLSREVYGDICPAQLENAAQRGTAVHAATVELDANGTVECDDAILPYLQAYALFLREHDVRWELTEHALAHPQLLYAGTLDRVGWVDGRYAIVDFKTTATVQKTLVKAQLNGYCKLLEQHPQPVERLYCLQLMADGRYRLYPVAIDSTEFMAQYWLHCSLKKKHKRGRIE